MTIEILSGLIENLKSYSVYEWLDMVFQYNKYLRNLSQSPWIDKDDVRIKHSVQELIEEGLFKYLKFDKSVFSSSGREDVDVRMLGRGRPFVFKMVNPWDESTYSSKTLKLVQDFVNTKHVGKVHVRDLQVVSKEGVSKYLKDGEESKTKEYRALCCCSRKLTPEDIERVAAIKDLEIDQKTPIRVLHRRSLAVRRRKVHQMSISELNPGDFDVVPTGEDLDRLFVLTLLTEAGTYIKEFVHGDFGRTEPSLADILGDCDTDLMELDVMEVYLDWPPPLTNSEVTGRELLAETAGDRMDRSETSLTELYAEALKAMKEAESSPRGTKRQDNYLVARRKFEQAMDLIESLDLFSDNETIDDVATANLKYLLIPAYLAKIAISAECGSDRLATFRRAELMLKRFFEHILSYGLGDESVERAMRSEISAANQTPGQQVPASLESAMQSRTEKIERYKRVKILEDRVDELERRVSLSDQVDEEVARDYYLSLVRKWTNECLESFEREVQPAIFFELGRSGETDADSASSSRVPTAPVGKPFKTMTIVKNDQQKQVFGMGYPSRPTVTVDEFISKKISDGDLAFHAQKEVYANSLQRYAEQPNLMREQEENSDEEREKKEEKEDAEELDRKRRWDEFKDDNPRGSGNRYNMG